MMALRSTSLAVLVAGLVLLVGPGRASADGDPASDVLLIANVFYPYQETVSNNLIAALNLTAQRANTAKFPIRVAIIATPADLGAIPELFGKPQQYANFLDREISFNTKAVLLVVMKSGFGLVASGPASALTGLHVPIGGGSDGLAADAIRAVGLLAAHAGHPITLPPIPAGGGATGSHNSALVTFAAPVALVLLVVAVVAFTRPASRAGETDEDDADDAGSVGPDTEPDEPRRDVGGG
jgi:hypothetical protein